MNSVWNINVFLQWNTATTAREVDTFGIQHEMRIQLNVTSTHFYDLFVLYWSRNRIRMLIMSIVT